MSHRLQVLFAEDEFAAVRAAAHRERVTVSEFVRQTLRQAVAGDPAVSAPKKLLIVREAATHAYPTGDPEVIEREIERGYPGDAP